MNTTDDDRKLSSAEIIYVAEYSPEQNCFHIEWKSAKYEKAHEYIVEKRYKEGDMNEPLWIPFFEGTHDEVCDAIDRMTKDLELRFNEEKFEYENI